MWRDIAAHAGVFLIILLLIGVIVVNVFILSEVSCRLVYYDGTQATLPGEIEIALNGRFTL